MKSSEKGPINGSEFAKLSHEKIIEGDKRQIINFFKLRKGKNKQAGKGNSK